MKPIALTLALLLPAFIASAETSSRGELRMESRFFNDDNNSLTEDLNYGLAGRLELTNTTGNLTSRMQLFSRVDRKDPTRQRFNIEELFTQYDLSSFELFAGFKTLNWSTAEAFHPADIINSRNFDSNFENAEKLGEMMIGSNYLSENFNLMAFYMPLLQRPQFPAESNRISFIPAGANAAPLVFVDNDGNFKESDDTANQWALRAQVPVDDLELNLYWVHHYDRTDIKTITNSGTGQIIPVMTPVDHYGFSGQYVYDAWIFKTEMVYRDFEETINVPRVGATLTQWDYGLIALATEYLMSHQGGSDTTFIMEFQELVGVDRAFRYRINPFQRDLLFGVRHSFNDVSGKEIFFSIIGDVERSREILASASYSQRLSDVWKIKTSVRYIDAPPSGPFDITGFRQLNNDHQLAIELSRYF